jgi:hypothetical protein
MASTYIVKAIDANGTDHGDAVVYVPPNGYQDLDVGKEQELPERLNDRYQEW